MCNRFQVFLYKFIQNKNDYNGWFFFEVVGLFLIILCVLFFGNSIWQKITQPSILKNISVSISNQIQNPSGQGIPLQEVKNLGYDFYVGQIDDPNVNDLTDDLKNQITQIVYNAHFPESMLQNMPIIILNSLDVTGNQYGLYHYTDPKQIKADFKRDHYSDGDDFYTIRIPFVVHRRGLKPFKLWLYYNTKGYIAYVLHNPPTQNYISHF
jgi:hypothetical protein